MYIINHFLKNILFHLIVKVEIVRKLENPTKHFFFLIKIVQYFKNSVIFLIKLHGGRDDAVRHEDVGEDVGEEAEGPGWLGYDQEVDEGVEDPSSGEQSVKSRLKTLLEIPAHQYLKQKRAVL